MPIRRFSKLPPLIAAAIIATATGLTATPPAHAQDFIVNLMSVQNSKCLQPLNGSLEGGVAIVQATCNGSLAQQWTSAPAHHGMTFTNGASGMCLDARGNSAAGTPIQQWPCAPGNGISNQFWNYSANGNELVSEVNPNPNSFCLATPGFDDGNPMALQRCDDSNPQLWNHPLSAPVANHPLSAPVASSPGDLYVALPTEMPINPNPQDIQTEVLWVGDWLKPGEIRRVTDQLAIRIPGGKEAEVNNRIRCFDEDLVIEPGASSGTNYPAGGQDYQWNGSTLLVAPNPLPPNDNGVSPPQAFFNCQILVYTSKGGDTGYQMLVLPPPAPKVHVCAYIDHQFPTVIIPTTLNLISIQNRKCLQPLNGSLEGGVAIVQATCNGSLAQQWTSAPADPHGMTFINGASGMCLDARGNSAAGTPIQQCPCAPGDGISNQFWNYSLNGNELVSEVNPNPNSFCLATPGNDDGNPMALQRCDDSNPQLWNHPMSEGQIFTVGNDVTAIDGEATMEVTTCDNNTNSCKSSEYGGDNSSTGEAFLEFKQLNPDGSPCQVNRASTASRLSSSA
jgi:hypothetical protein